MIAAAADGRPTRRLGRLLLGRVLIAGFALAVVFSLLQAGLDYRRRVADLRKDQAFIEAQYGRALAESLWKMDRSLVGAQVDGIRNRPYYARVAVVENGVATHEIGRSPTGPAIRWELPLSFEHRGKPVPLGTLQVEADAGLVLRDVVRRFALFLLLQLATVGITGAMLLSIFNRLVTRHLDTASRYFGTFAGDGTDPPLRLEKAASQDELDLLAGSFNDLRERLAASQRALRESEEKYRTLYREAALGIFHSTLDGKFIDVNPALARLLGYDSPEQVLASVTSIAGQVYAEAPVYDEVARQVLEAGGTLTRENRYRRRDGTHWTGMLSLRLVRDAQGPGHYEGFVEDITERKRAEEALRDSQQILENILNTIPVRVFWKDRNLVYLGCNVAFARDAGFSDPQEIVGKDDYQLGWRAQADLYRGDDREVIESGRPKLLVEEPQTTPEGATITLLTSKIPLRDPQGEISGVLGTYLDITGQVRAREEKAGLEDQLRQAQKMEAVGRLAGGVAHDFNNLTAIVLGYGERLLDELLPEDPRRRSAEQIVTAGRRSAALVNQLLAFGRKQTLQPRVLELNGLLQKFEEMLARLIGEDVELVFKLAADPGRVKADPGQIEQVITNLAVNARDAMPLGGRLTIETADVALDESFVQGSVHVVPGRYVALFVTDTGCGMDEATLARIFEPFFTTKPKGKGTGLGLATVYGIVKQSAGYVWADSEAGTGTTFRIYLPRRDEEPEVKEIAAVVEAPRGHGERILLVEDETPLRELCVSMLERLGYRVSSAAGGLEALQLVRELRLEPDLVLTDVIMPGMGGAQMAERLRRDQPDLEVLYMSGYPDDAVSHHGVLEPGTHLIQKPFSEGDIARKVREILTGNAAGALQRRRVLMIDDDAAFMDLVGHHCAKRGHSFAGVDSPAAALAALAGRSFDVLLVDMNIPGTNGERVLREIRAAGHAAPAIVLTGDVASANMDVLGPLGAVSVLEKSSSAEPLLRAIEAACTGKS